MNSGLRDLLDKIYELEGLVHLALKRDDMANDFLRLISKKGNEIGSLSKCLWTEMPETNEENREREVTEEVIMEESDENEVAHDTEKHTDEEGFKEGKEGKEGKEENEETNTESFFLEEYSIYDDPEDNDSTDITEDETENEDDSEADIPQIREIQRGKLVFSINDRFRFKKELFDNSDVDFNNTLALVASMENYEEAEDYFLNEEGFDKNYPVVKEFLEVLKRYFK